MNMTKGPARLGFAAALLALLIAPLAFGVHSAHAQGPTQNIYYGTGLDDGVMIAASIDDVVCDETANSAADGWVIYVDDGACGGGAADGATIVFTLDGAKAEQTVTWSPANVEQLTLTVAVMVEPTATAEATATEEPVDTMGPEMMTTGNAGLVSSESGSPLLALVLGFLAVAGLAGARVSTRRVS
jgi:hypothetical protein